MTTTGPAGTTPGLAGRESEMFRLGAAWGAASRGRSALVLVTGVAGIGTTRLATETVRLARRTGGTVLKARCYDMERALFLQPFVEAVGAHAAHLAPAPLRQLAGDRAGVLAGLVPQVDAVLGPVPGDLAGGRPPRPDPDDVESGYAWLGARRRAYEAVTDLLRALADQEPVLLVLDDLHNAGLATVELLGFLARSAAETGTRLLVVATVRPAEGDAALRALAGVATRIDVGPLPPPAVRQLVTDAGHADAADLILDRTRGHPLFVVEALRGLAEGAPEVPESLPAAIVARVRATGAATEGVLRAAAVLGTSIDPATLARLVDLPLPVTARHCETAVSAGLLAVSGRSYEFAHDLVRDALYETTPPAARRGHHRRAAHLLSHHPEAVAAHAVAVADWRLAARAWRSAAAEATRRFAEPDAEALLVNAADATARADGQPAGTDSRPATATGASAPDDRASGPA
jgi:predicted ATPase